MGENPRRDTPPDHHATGPRRRDYGALAVLRSVVAIGRVQLREHGADDLSAVLDRAEEYLDRQERCEEILRAVAVEIQAGRCSYEQAVFAIYNALGEPRL